MAEAPDTTSQPHSIVIQTAAITQEEKEKALGTVVEDDPLDAKIREVRARLEAEKARSFASDSGPSQSLSMWPFPPALHLIVCS
jgi:hypothetical protein